MVNTTKSTIPNGKAAQPSRPAAAKVMQAKQGQLEELRGLPTARSTSSIPSLVRRGAAHPDNPLMGADDGTPDSVERSLSYIYDDYYGRPGKRLPKSDPPSKKRGSIPPDESVIGAEDEAPDAVEKSIEALKEDLAENEDEKAIGTTVSKLPTIRPVPGNTEVEIPKAPKVPEGLAYLSKMAEKLLPTVEGIMNDLLTEEEIGITVDTS